MFLMAKVDTHFVFLVKLIISLHETIIDVYNIFPGQKEIPITTIGIYVKMLTNVHFTYSVNRHSHKKTTFHITDNVPGNLRPVHGPSLTGCIMSTMTRPSILIFMLVCVVCQYSYMRTLIQDLYSKMALASPLFRKGAPAFICIFSSFVLRAI